MYCREVPCNIGDESIDLCIDPENSAYWVSLDLKGMGKCEREQLYYQEWNEQYPAEVARWQHKEAALYTGIKQAWYEGGTWPNPLVIGVVSISFTSIRGFRLKFCKIVVKNKKSSMRARPSPAHIRFPEDSKNRFVTELLCCELTWRVWSK